MEFKRNSMKHLRYSYGQLHQFKYLNLFPYYEISEPFATMPDFATFAFDGGDQFIRFFKE